MTRTDEGQAIVVVAICVAVLVAGLAFAVDWGYGMAQRKVMQNVADAAALGAGRYLASSVIWITDTSSSPVYTGPAFNVTQEQAWCAAKSYDTPNRSFAPLNSPTHLDLYYSSDGTTWTLSLKPAGETCPTNGTSAPPRTAIYVRAVATTTFPSLVASVVGNSANTASASARVRLSGTPVTLIGGPMWTMVRHYNASDFTNTCANGAITCDTTDPSQVVPKTFWDSNAADVAYGSFKGLIDFSRNSPNFNSQLSIQTPQLMAAADSWAHPPGAPLAADHSGGCTVWGTSPRLWDSWGEASANQDKQCSIDNWVYYGFRGTLSLESNWSASLPTGQEAPTTLTTRTVCSPPPNPAPSCANPNLGDWVETAGGTISNLTDVVRSAVQDRGSSAMPFSNKFVPGTTTLFGRGLVVIVFLWECGESFNKNGGAGNRWNLINGNGDCSQLSSAPDRVHLFTAAPFTVYEGTISSGSVKGYWGGLFGSPDACQTCALNALANTAVLVPDS